MIEDEKIENRSLPPDQTLSQRSDRWKILSLGGMVFMASLAACVALPIFEVQAPTVPLLGPAETPYPTATSTATSTLTPKPEPTPKPTSKPTPTSSAKWDVEKLRAAQTQIAQERALLYPPSTPNPGIK